MYSQRLHTSSLDMIKIAGIGFVLVNCLSYTTFSPEKFIISGLVVLGLWLSLGCRSLEEYQLKVEVFLRLLLCFSLASLVYLVPVWTAQVLIGGFWLSLIQFLFGVYAVTCGVFIFPHFTIHKAVRRYNSLKQDNTLNVHHEVGDF